MRELVHSSLIFIIAKNRESNPNVNGKMDRQIGSIHVNGILPTNKGRINDQYM